MGRKNRARRPGIMAKGFLALALAVGLSNIKGCPLQETKLAQTQHVFYQGYSKQDEAFANTLVSHQRDYLDGLEKRTANPKNGKGVVSQNISVVRKNSKHIDTACNKYGVPRYVAYAVALAENGGSEDAISHCGARGVMQLMPGIARAYGLRVDKKADERKKPEKNIDAGVRYLSDLYEGDIKLNREFGTFRGCDRWDLAMLSYNQGPGAIYRTKKGHVRTSGVQNMVLKYLNSTEGKGRWTRNGQIDYEEINSYDVNLARIFRRIKEPHPVCRTYVWRGIALKEMYDRSARGVSLCRNY
ncbi:MAG: transglycosylase SLT domain-containing protein [Candidatus Aenigmarchaeota archaeon]|nr:transglycosylase SLT domain-containing protein [Candidatus Aenigmarchaeota archaeon]